MAVFRCFKNTGSCRAIPHNRPYSCVVFSAGSYMSRLSDRGLRGDGRSEGSFAPQPSYREFAQRLS